MAWKNRWSPPTRPSLARVPPGWSVSQARKRAIDVGQPGDALDGGCEELAELGERLDVAERRPDVEPGGQAQPHPAFAEFLQPGLGDLVESKVAASAGMTFAMDVPLRVAIRCPCTALSFREFCRVRFSVFDRRCVTVWRGSGRSEAPGRSCVFITKTTVWPGASLVCAVCHATGCLVHRWV